MRKDKRQVVAEARANKVEEAKVAFKLITDSATLLARASSKVLSTFKDEGTKEAMDASRRAHEATKAAKATVLEAGPFGSIQAEYANEKAMRAHKEAGSKHEDQVARYTKEGNKETAQHHQNMVDYHYDKMSHYYTE